MSYQAVICRLENVRKHPCADRLKLAIVLGGEQVIVGLDAQNGDLGVYFPQEGQLSPEMAKTNNLYSHSELNSDVTKKGLFCDKARIRCQKIRGEISEGFWTELSTLEWTGVGRSTLKEGFEFTALNGKEVCRKYVPQRKNKGSSGRQNKTRKERSKIFGFRQHFDTKHLRREIKKIADNSVIYLTVKAHGTSARTGHLLVEKTKKVGRLKNWWLKITKRRPPIEAEWRIVTGTRRVDFDPFGMDEAKTYEERLTAYGRSNRDYRIKASDMLAKAGIPKGYTIYHELVGYELTSKPIMPSSSVEKIKEKDVKEHIRTLYGDRVNYSYGCEPLNQKEAEEFYKDPNAKNPFRILVYRVTHTNPEGLQEDLSWQQVKKFCKERGLETVVEVDKPFVWVNYKVDGERLIDKVNEYIDGPDPLDNKHLREGICVRIENEAGTYILKDKSIAFRLLEQGLIDLGISSVEEEGSDEEDNSTREDQ